MPARRRPLTLAPALMAGAVLLLAAVPARAQDAHGAIAFGQNDRDQAVAYGVAWDYPSRDDAQEAAVNACLDGGGSDCTVLAWFQNGCGALAMDQYGMAQGKGARTLEQAEARALQTCEAAGGVGCAVVGSQCVSPGGRPGTWSGSESVLVAPAETAGPSGPTAEPAAAQDRPATDAPRDEGLMREARDEAEVLAAAGAREQPAAGETTGPDRGSGNQILYFAAAGPKCAELGSHLDERDAGCWQEIQSRPGCFIWIEKYYGAYTDYTADWTGLCSGDTAHGRGSYSFSYSFPSGGRGGLTGLGSVMHGKPNGHWVIRYPKGNVSEGPYVDGERNGHWVIRFADGRVWEGPIIDGEWHGHWVFRDADGDIEEGLYVGDGERHGHWVFRYASGGSLEFEYSYGSREGQSGIYQTPDGNRYPGRWSGDCFRDAEGRAWVWYGTKEDACGS